jgi:hypothetical protein
MEKDGGPSVPVPGKQVQYLSTDPNAGLEDEQPVYLSTDPNAGEPVAAQPQAPQQDSRSWLTKLQDGTAHAILNPVDTVVDNLPTIGGAVGGTIGGVGGSVFGLGFGGVPGAIGGAAAGGATGEAFQQLINRYLGKETPKSAQEAAMGIAKSGAWEGGTQLVGGALASGATKLGTGLVKSAFKPTAKMLKESPTLIQDLIQNSVNPTARGAAKAGARTTASRVTADNMVASAGRNAKPVPSSEVLDALVTNPYGHQSSLEHVTALGEQTPGLNRLGEYGVNFLNDNPQALSYQRLHELARAEGKAGKAVFEGTSSNPTLEKLIHADINAGARNALEKRIPGFADVNANTQNHLFQTKAAERAAANHQADLPGFFRRHGAATLAAGALFPAGLPASLGAAGVAEVIGNPTARAIAGRGAARAGKLPYANLFRAGKVANDTHTEGPQDVPDTSSRGRKATSKAKVDSLWEQYNQG